MGVRPGLRDTDDRTGTGAAARGPPAGAAAPAATTYHASRGMVPRRDTARA